MTCGLNMKRRAAQVDAFDANPRPGHDNADEIGRFTMATPRMSLVDIWTNLTNAKLTDIVNRCQDDNCHDQSQGRESRSRFLMETIDQVLGILDEDTELNGTKRIDDGLLLRQ